MTGTGLGTAIDRFLVGIEAGDIPIGIFAPGAHLDATVPNWRFTVRGAEAVRAEFRRWYADAGSFSDLQRTPLDAGELVVFTLTWTENGVPHTCHQAHILRLQHDQVSADTVFCGGRWPAALVAEMQRVSQEPGPS